MRLRGGGVVVMGRRGRGGPAAGGRRILVALFGLLVGAIVATPSGAVGQGMLQATEEIILATGNSTVIVHGATLERVSVGNPDVADPVVVSAREVLLHGRAPGTTTLLVWDEAGGRRAFTVRVNADPTILQRELNRLFPGEPIEVSAMGNTLILSGRVADPQAARRALALAQTLGENVRVIDQIAVPERGQILLKVRFAEVSRSALDELGPELYLYEGTDVVGALGTGRTIRPSQDEDFRAEVLSDAVNFFVFHDPSKVTAFVNALQNRGLLKSLAEPNLLAMPAESASFLAGGEFPVPVVQSGAAAGAVTVQFKEFGIRLNFVPDITNSGAIRLNVAPEVSALDFTSGLDVSGFRIPALISRRARTVIELEDGQTFAIAGLLDNSLSRNVSKIPLLGDIPILGALFRSEDIRQNRSELLVLVTPHIVRPLDEAPPVPTGEPDTWEWRKSMRNPPAASGDTAGTDAGGFGGTDAGGGGTGQGGEDGDTGEGSGA